MSNTIPVWQEQPSKNELATIISGYETMLLSVLNAILERGERDLHYPFIDTKLNLQTGADLYPPCHDGEAFKDRKVIYSWIQGRGLEALAGHLEWLKETNCVTVPERDVLCQRIKTQINRTAKAMESCRVAHGGRVYFCMTPTGDPLAIENYKFLVPAQALPSTSNYSDLFYAKGVFKAAIVMGWKTKADEAAQYFKQVIDDIDANRFCTDQQAFDPQNQVKYVNGKISQGPMMIALSGIAELASANSDQLWFSYGEKFIRRIIEQHINHGQYPNLQQYDFIESVNTAGRPWQDDNGVILCDPGHALEFIGLAAKCLLAMRKAGYGRAFINECVNLFPPLLVHCFELGFNRSAGGICKAYDLHGRTVINSDMPWWSLPETMRAAVELLALAPNTSYRKEIMAIIADCSNAFAGRFINYDVHMMAYQTRNATGNVVDVIPATPDADPGYHTGLSIIDFLRLLKLI